MEPGRQNTGVVLEFERAAMKGEQIPRGLSGVEQGKFWGLSYLYKLYRGGYISREDAAAEKNRLLAAFKKAERMMEFQRRLTEYTAGLWRTVGACNRAYHQERTLEHADALSAAVYGQLRTIPAPPEERDGMYFCPCCGRLFEPEHAARRPRFCEDCGAGFRWEATGSGDTEPL